MEKVNVKVIAMMQDDIPGPQLKVVSFLLDLSRNPICTCTADFLGLNILLEYRSLIFLSYFTIPSSGESRINLPLQSFFSQAMLSYPASNLFLHILIASSVEDSDSYKQRVFYVPGRSSLKLFGLEK